MKILAIAVLSAGLFSITPSQSTTAYVCSSPSSKKYHYSKSCRGIQKCTHEIKKTTVDAAKKSGYTVCLIET